MINLELHIDTHLVSKLLGGGGEKIASGTEKWGRRRDRRSRSRNRRGIRVEPVRE